MSLNKINFYSWRLFESIIADLCSLSSVFSTIIRLTMWQGTGNKWNKHCVELERNGFFHWDEMEHISK